VAKNRKILNHFFDLKKSGKKAVALLIDPDKLQSLPHLDSILEDAAAYHADFIFIGGSLVDLSDMNDTITYIKEIIPDIPLILFPGNVSHFSEKADAMLFISLISGRNADLLIGQHVLAAPLLAKSQLEVLPTGYMLVDGGGLTTVQYVSQTLPLPNNKPEIALATAMAGKYLGLQLFYMDAGSGAKTPVSRNLIRAVSQGTGNPLIVGGGIDSIQKAKAAWEAGADVVVIGNGAEKNPGLYAEVLQYTKVYNVSLNVN
jgi:putative glycerol-1-phosphate prenyltransferase